MIRCTPAPTGAVKVTFALPLDAAPTRCSVVGDFNAWEPGRHELRRRTNGTRSASVVVPAGSRMRFRYLGENGYWFNDPDVPEYVGEDSLLSV
jgi:1,4-alpha-glucan branching enzyme